MVSKCVIEVSIIWLNGNIYTGKHLISTIDVQTRNVGKLRYVKRRAPTECPHRSNAATECQRWRDVGCRSRRCRPMPTLGQRHKASWCALYHPWQQTSLAIRWPNVDPLDSTLGPQRGPNVPCYMGLIFFALCHQQTLCFENVLGPVKTWPEQVLNRTTFYSLAI